MAQTVSCATVAKALNLTERRVMQLVNEGMPRAGRGEYDPWACALWYIRYLQKAVEQRGTGNDDGSATSWREEKKRLVRLQANNEELEYRRKLGELAPVEVFESKIVEFATTVKGRFLALPSKIAPRLEGESRDVIRLKLFEAVKDLFNGLAEGRTGKASGRASRAVNRAKSRKVDSTRKRSTRGCA
jgi:phage terminase Nu1 subunit (DNA packaging protein)